MRLDLTLLTLGVLFLVGLAADELGRRTRLPRVTLLLLAGVLAGRSGFDLVPAEAETWYEFLSVSALTMVAFLLGSALTRRNLAAHGTEIVLISISIVLVTLVVVAGGLSLIGVPVGLALLLGAIATATAPAATEDTIRQSGMTGAFPDKLRGIVAVDDAWGLLAFSLMTVAAGELYGNGQTGVVWHTLREIGGAVLLGAVVGIPGAALTGRIKPGEPLQTEALGLVFLTAGLAMWLGVSYLLAGMTAGMLIVNFARHHRQAFHEIENVRWPFMVLFFLLAGVSLELDHLATMGGLGLAYLGLRITGRIIGGWLGARIGGEDEAERPWFGIALLPQAGVAIGMALVAAESFPDWSETIITLTIGTTVIFELLGPPATLFALRRVVGKESGKTSAKGP
ncbi:cation:proton antiporter [Nioella aestuarii]|uniref:cation:proton antiporter n=1 Tax=Nioella aestuarii TaxID=1662864 RepID=UPI003D7F866E